MADNTKSNWIIVSNRLPFTVNQETGVYQPSSGGLVSAITGIDLGQKIRWVGAFPGEIDKEKWNDFVSNSKNKFDYIPVQLTQTMYDLYYNGFCNDVLWPLLHYETSLLRFTEKAWQAYVKVNQIFADKILKSVKDDDILWIHDFHLFLLPKLLKIKRPKLRIGFFLHVTFPSSEIYRQLPVRTQILESLVYADLIGFHDYSYLRHFISSARTLLGIDSNLLDIKIGNHTAKLGVFPVSIDTHKFINESQSAPVKRTLKYYNKENQSEFLILGVDRLDYIKGIELKLHAFRQLLIDHPELIGKIELLQVAVPSRTDVKEYQELRQHIEQLIGEINGEFGGPTYVPIHYMFTNLPFHELLALYQLADLLFISSKRDGMNLVALEYIASQGEKNPGLVMLSEFAGCISTLSHAIPINPWNITKTARKLFECVECSKIERQTRHSAMIEFLKKYTASTWAKSFITQLSEPIKEIQVTKEIDEKRFSKITGKNPEELILFLDYDGTIVPIVSQPEHAIMPKPTKDLINKLCKKNIEIIVISGRNKQFLSQQFEGLNVSLVAEHGANYRAVGKQKWRKLVFTDKNLWYSAANKLMRDFTIRTPGSFVEKKDWAITWHYRMSPKEFGEYQASKLREELNDALANLPVAVITGKKVIEVKSLEANKGIFVNWYLENVPTKGKNIVAIGDDETDEDLFEAIKGKGVSLKVGTGLTFADYRISNQDELEIYFKSLL